MTPTDAPAPALHGPRAKDPWFYGWRYVTRTRPDGTTFSEQVPLTSQDVLHPQEGDFIVTSDAHDQVCDYLKGVFRWRLRDRSGALVLKDHRIDWQRAGLLPHGPDVTVFSDAPAWDRHRATYPVGEMGANPLLVIEVTSPSTRNKDLGEKVAHYARAGIPQYVIVDLQEDDAGWAVEFLEYRPTPAGPVRSLPAEPNRVWLEAVELWLAAEGDEVVCLLPDGTQVNDFPEVMAELDSARAERDALAAERDAERLRADAEQRRADAERLRADAEQQRADAAEAKMQQMEAELRRLRGETP